MPATSPPERIDAGPIVLRRARPEDAEVIAEAVGHNLEHIRAWMPWATPDAATAEAQRDRLRDTQWEDGSEYGYLMVSRDDDAVLGACSMMRRIGAGGIEIGYWVHLDHTGRGIATAAAGALTSAALALDDVERVEIHCDEANLSSQAVPKKLGYTLDAVVDEVIDAPAKTGRTMIWVMRAGLLDAEA